MKYGVRTLILVVSGLVLSGPAVSGPVDAVEPAGATDEVTVGVFLHSPYVERDGSGAGLRGAGIEYMTAVLTEMGYAARFVVQPFSRVIVSLASGEIDASFNLMKTPERETFAYFPELPALRVGPVLVVRSGSTLADISSVHDLQGLNICYVQDSSVPEFLLVPGVFSFDFVRGQDWITQNLLKLLAKRCDAILDLNPHSYAIAADRQNLGDRIRIIPLPVEPTDFYVVFSRNSPRGAALVAAYNDVRAQEKQSYTDFIEPLLR
ncbi:hypothetical protein AU468_02995 [Alkalispirochaeta sphaeroplastigenens]|uniref:Solute-binding protein family 3/N-terminal domain-containing protein n=1 Tax=Alkalispirochaeta sphaeroplastigenens TaxID=1187066 RepID=A0A2S4JYS4_9SPIO|nr:transporter substrate-binding domain-containing protein [Alkalispirochaeta sphaeroplastigenens]POR04656.1 hypothetical protein AU468_02995 [Alkalispirochaeta sphaeroplastigenens]